MTYSTEEGNHVPRRPPSDGGEPGPGSIEALAQRRASVAEHLRLLVRGGYHAGFVVRGNGEILWSSASAGRLFERKPEALRGESVFSLFCDRDLLSTFRGFAKMTCHGASYATWKVRLSLGDHGPWYEVAASNLLASERCIVLVMQELI